MALIAFGLGALIGGLFGAFFVLSVQMARADDQGYVSEGLWR